MIVRCLLSLLVMGALLSCEVLSVKTVDLPAAPSRLVVVGLATNRGIGIYVSKTVPVLSLSMKADSQSLDAQVSLMKDGAKIADLQKSTFLYTSDHNWEYDQSYTLSVPNSELGTASATLEPLPGRIAIQGAIAEVGEFESEAKISFTFQDSSGNDYYAYQIIPAKNGIPLTNSSPYQIPFGNLLDDTGFTNQSKTVSYRVLRTAPFQNGQAVTADQFIIYLHHLSKKTYDYYRSLLEYDSFYEDTFAGEIPVVNNVKNGYGFIGMSYIDSVTVDLKK